MSDENILPFLHNRSAEVSVSLILEDMRSIENNPDGLRQRLLLYSNEVGDFTPFNIQSILTSVAIVKLSQRMDEIAIKHSKRLCTLINVTGHPGETLIDKFKRIPLIGQFRSEVNWIINQQQKLDKFLEFGGKRNSALRIRQQTMDENEFENITKRSMNQYLVRKIPQKKFEKFITDYTS